VRAHSPLAADPRTTHPAPQAGDGHEERSWLVFRLGPHRICADTRAVEGIIEPPRITRLPSTPPYVLGVFPFREQYALAVSLARKLAVDAGGAAAAGPFVVARVDGKFAAFQVDEAQDVLQPEDAHWQPLPEMLRDELFDRYTLRDEDLILHTSFAALLNARPGRDLSSVRQGLGVPQSTPAPMPAPSPSMPAPPPAAARAQVEAPAATAPRATPAPVAPPAPPAMAPRARESAERKLVARAPAPPPRLPLATREQPAPSTEGPPPQALIAEEPEQPAHAAVLAAPAPDVLAPAERSSARSAPPAPAPEAPQPGLAAARPVREPVATAARPAPPALPAASPALAAPAAPGGSDWALPAWTALAVAALLAVLAWLWPHNEPTRAPQAVAHVAATAPKVERREAEAVPAEVPAPRPPAAPVVEVKTDSFTLTVERPADTAAAATAPAPAPASARAPTAPAQRVTYVVVRGDTLWAIARRFLCNPFRYPELAALSGIRNPDLIHPGDIVRIERK
jgi:chemotaxis signal transduction protein/LysM repeat protein